MEDLELGADETFGSDVGLTGDGCCITFVIEKSGDIGLGRANSYLVAMNFLKQLFAQL
jgi:hypothetical protein